MRSFGPGQVLQDRDLAAGAARGLAHELRRLGVLLGAAVREVQARDVHAGLDHPDEHLRVARGGADRGHDLRAAHHRRSTVHTSDRGQYVCDVDRDRGRARGPASRGAGGGRGAARAATPRAARRAHRRARSRGRPGVRAARRAVGAEARLRRAVEVFISVNAAAVHGVPGPRRLRRGDLVKLDVTAELDGFYADACITVACGPASPAARRLISATDAALARAMTPAVSGAPVARSQRGHLRRGDGARRVRPRRPRRARHRPHDPRGAVGPERLPTSPTPPVSTTGLVITIEPILGAGGPDIRESGDGWTIRTADGALAAHSEHTIVVTGGPTAGPNRLARPRPRARAGVRSRPAAGRACRRCSRRASRRRSA